MLKIEKYLIERKDVPMKKINDESFNKIFKLKKFKDLIAWDTVEVRVALFAAIVITVFFVKSSIFFSRVSSYSSCLESISVFEYNKASSESNSLFPSGTYTKQYFNLSQPISLIISLNTRILSFALCKIRLRSINSFFAF